MPYCYHAGLARTDGEKTWGVPPPAPPHVPAVPVHVSCTTATGKWKDSSLPLNRLFASALEGDCRLHNHHQIAWATMPETFSCRAWRSLAISDTVFSTHSCSGAQVRSCLLKLNNKLIFSMYKRDSKGFLELWEEEQEEET